MNISLAYFKKHSTVSVVAAIVVLLVASTAARMLKHGPASSDEQSSQPVVQLINTKDFSQSVKEIAVNGAVESLEQADLRSQATGKVTKVSITVGQKVSKGQVLVGLEQSSQQAALTSARGGLAQAQANYSRVVSGASNEDITVAQVALDNAKSSLESTQKQQQVAVDNASKALLNSGISAIAGSGNTDTVTASVTGTYTGKEQGAYKVTIYGTGAGLHYQVSSLETGDGLVGVTPQPLGTKGLYIQFSSTSVPTNNFWTVTIPNTQSASYVANNNAYQAALQSQTSAIAAAQNAVTAAQANLDLKKAQARPAEVQAAQAQILSAQGQVQAAEVAVENTITRAPFSGVISAVPVKFADLITAGSNVVSIVSSGGLQIKIFVSDTDLASVHAGDVAKIGKDGVAGTVTNVAPSVNTNTKTAEVDVSVDNPSQSGLTVGQNVLVVIAGKNSSPTLENSFLLPIQAVKITPDGHNYVYTLDESSKAREVEVTVGKVDGERVEVTGGIQNGVKILSNAYGISVGDQVKTQ